ncbi:MAG: hypothetical protein ACU88J_00960 [Gammaproteobacteria bacterium]
MSEEEHDFIESEKKVVKFIFTGTVSQEKDLTHWQLAMKFTILKKMTILARKRVFYTHNQMPDFEISY